MDKYRREIRDIARTRGITELFHFSPLPNAPSILVHGLVSRTILQQNDVNFWITDEKRFDNQLDYTSTSIHSLSQEMFDAKRADAPGQWFIVGIDVSVLWIHDCLFNWRNASSGEMLHYTRKGNFIGGPWAFNKMFEDAPYGLLDPTPRRQKFERPPYLPTFNDAEVQVYGHIQLDKITRCIFETERAKDQALSTLEEGTITPAIEVCQECFA